MNPPPPPLKPGSSLLPALQPARVQFIQNTFPELATTTDAYGRLAMTENAVALLRWIHDRLFLDGWDLSAVRTALNRSFQKVRVIAVTSGKGGVGKTTLSVNLAVAMAQLGQRVLLFDADLGMANVHVFAGINPKATLLDVIDRRADLSGILEPGPGGIQVLCGASGVGRLADLTKPVIEALGRELLAIAAEFDVLIIDTGAGISSMVTHFLSIAHEAIVVATPNIAATLDAYGVVKVAHEYRLPTRLHLLINLAEDDAQAERVTDRITGCARQFLNSAPGSLGSLRRDTSVEQSSQSRRPIVITDPANVNSLRITGIARAFIHQAAAPAAAETSQPRGIRPPTLAISHV